MDEKQIIADDEEDKFTSLKMDYEWLWLTNKYLGENNVKLMQRSTQLKDALIAAIIVLDTISDNPEFVEQFPELLAKIDAFFTIEDPANLRPFAQHDQAAATA